MNPASLQDALKKEMDRIAAWIRDHDGFIGHVKAGIEEKKTTMLSITDQELNEKSSGLTVVTVNLASIAFGISIEELEEEVGRTLQALTSEKF